eukprot:2813630-Amphidinium_carterae.1
MELRSSQTPQLHELSHKGNDLDVRNTYVHVHWLWVQDKVLAKEATVEAVNTTVNVADALTKA